jgi:ABC-type phosphate/phosphonate transport system substrate-binding protein
VPPSSDEEAVQEFMYLFVAFYDAASSSGYIMLNDWMINGNEFERAWMKMVTALCKIMS